MKNRILMFLMVSVFLMSQIINASDIYTDFSDLPAGPFTEIQSSAGHWQVIAGQVEINSRFSAAGNNCLRLMGGSDNIVEFTPVTKTAGASLTFKAERWTSAQPFKFRIEALRQGQWQEIYNGDSSIKVGARFLSEVSVKLGAQENDKFRFICSAPENTGILIDALAIKEPVKMVLESVQNTKVTAAAFIGHENSQILRIQIEATGQLEPLVVSSLEIIANEGTTSLYDIDSVSIFYTGNNGNFSSANIFGSKQSAKAKMTFDGQQILADGSNYFWVAYKVNEKANITHRLGAGCLKVHFADGRSVKPAGPEFVSQRIGVALRRANQDNCHSYRIPGLVTTNQGSLIAVYDARWRNSGDLPGDIDVGMSRSTDGGQTWQPMKIIMNMGNDPQHNYDGIGDPTILVDRNTGTIWVGALWSHGNKGWHGSQPGLEPHETGQFILVKSEDDGLTWSEPINITKQIKKPQWCLLLQGPGKGFTMRDGTLIMPAQYQDSLENRRVPYSTFIYSKDNGKNWSIATGAKSNTTEAQMVELDNGSLMINMRDNRNGGDKSATNGRAVYITSDMGQTWQQHHTSNNDKYLPEPVCQASIIRFSSKKDGFNESVLLFANPNNKYHRTNLTIKASLDEGDSWPSQYQLEIYQPGGWGYSSMSAMNDDYVGIVYEGVRELYFEKIHISEILGENIILK